MNGVGTELARLSLSASGRFTFFVRRIRSYGFMPQAEKSFGRGGNGCSNDARSGDTARDQEEI